MSTWDLDPRRMAQFQEDGFLLLKSPVMRGLREELHRELKEVCLGVISMVPKFAADLSGLRDKPFASVFNWAVSQEVDYELTRPFYEIFPSVPAVISLVSNLNLLSLARELGVSYPLASTLPLLRIDRPKIDRWNTPAHQDYWYAMLSPNCLTYWFSVLEVSSEMGPLWVIPGSHKQGVLPVKPFTKENPFTTAEEFPDSAYVPVYTSPDEILIFNQCLVHKSGVNRSDRARLTLQMRYNDLGTLREPTASFTVNHSRYVLEAQRNLLSQSEA